MPSEVLLISFDNVDNINDNFFYGKFGGALLYSVLGTQPLLLMGYEILALIEGWPYFRG